MSKKKSARKVFARWRRSELETPIFFLFLEKFANGRDVLVNVKIMEYRLENGGFYVGERHKEGKDELENIKAVGLYVLEMENIENAILELSAVIPTSDGSEYDGRKIQYREVHIEEGAALVFNNEGFHR